MREKRKRPTIFDLVKYTGISRGTISRAFNDQPGINPQTREKVLKAAKAIGYQPHTGARMMKLSRKRRWGLLLPHLRNPYYSELVEALNKEARNRRTTILFGLSLDEVESEAIVEQWAGDTDGLILDQSYHRGNLELFQRLNERGVPIVFLHGTPIPGFDFVKYNLYDTFFRSLKCLKALGHQRIAFVGQEWEGCRRTARFRAYTDFHAQNQLPIDDALICFGEDGHQGGVSAWQHCAALAEPPTAVVCCDDIIACGVFQAARTQGLSMPRDLSICGVDDIAEAERLGLTTIRTDREQTSRAVLDLLERRLSDPNRPAEIAIVPSELIMRDSVAEPRSQRS